MPSTARILGHFTESVIREMTRVANAHQAINLSQGFPDFDPPGRIGSGGEKGYGRRIQPIRDYLGIAPLPPGPGPQTKSLDGTRSGSGREYRCHLRQHGGHDRGHDDRVRSGDKVIVFSPFYENYGADAILSGASPFTCRFARRNLVSTRMNFGGPSNRSQGPGSL